MYLIKKTPIILWSATLFYRINYLILQMSSGRPSLWNSLVNMVNFHQTHDDYDIQQSLTELSHFVGLSNIIQIEFQENFDISGWKYIQLILQACPNVTNLILNTRLLVLSKVIDNASLILIFKQIKMMKSLTQQIYSSSSFALKFVQRFPFLIHIELQVFSFDHCVSLIEIFLTHLKNLSYLKIYYNHDILLVYPFTREYIIGKRHQTFSNYSIEEQMVVVKNNGEFIEIRLS